MNYLQKIKAYVGRLYRIDHFKKRRIFIKDLSSTYIEYYEELSKSNDSKRSFRLTVDRIRGDNPVLARTDFLMIGLQLLACFLLAVSFILSFFDIMIVQKCSGPDICRSFLASPSLTVYSISFDFVVLLPSLVSIVFLALDLVKPSYIFLIIGDSLLALAFGFVIYLGYVLNFVTWAYVLLVVLMGTSFASGFSSLIISLKTSCKKQKSNF